MLIRNLRSFINTNCLEIKTLSEYGYRANKIIEFCNTKKEDDLVVLEDLSKFLLSVGFTHIPFPKKVKTTGNNFFTKNTSSSSSIIIEKIKRLLEYPVSFVPRHSIISVWRYTFTFCDDKSLANLNACNRTFYYATSRIKWKDIFEEQNVCSLLMETIIYKDLIKDLGTLYQNLKRFKYFTNTHFYFDKLWQLQLLSGELVAVKAALATLPETAFFHPVHLLCASNSLEAVKAGVDFFGSNFFKVRDSGVNKHIEFFETRHANVFSVFNYACCSPDPKILEFLFKAFEEEKTDHVRWNASRKLSENILHSACRMGHVPHISFLLNNQNLTIDNDLTTQGETYLHLACVSGSVQAVQKIIHFYQTQGFSKLDINIKTKSGFTVFHYACEFGNVSILQELKKIPNLNMVMTGPQGVTALHLACRSGSAESVKFLLSLQGKGGPLFNPLAVSERQENAFDFSERNRYAGKEIRQILIDHQIENIPEITASRRCIIM